MNFGKLLVITILFISLHTRAIGQCGETFKFTPYPSEKSAASGKIEIELKGTNYPYTFKTYQLDRKEIKLVNTTTVGKDKKLVVIESLEPAYYLTQVQYGSSCKETIGGVNGILIKSKNED